ncbi:MAG: glycoside hydrolase [Acidobacteriota bacterium]
MRCHRLLSFALPAVIIPALLATSSEAQPMPGNLFQEMHWRMIGPFRGGRTRAISGVPGQPNLFYMCPVDGGVWKSEDSGRTWTPIFDQESTQSVGAIAVAPSDSRIIYLASGEGLARPDLSVGNGIYKSTDAGRTWVHLGLRDGQQIPALVVDPRDPDRLFAAVLGHPYGPNAERGVFRSTNGGQTWVKVLYQNENIGAYDVDLDPGNPDVVYASLWEERQGPWEYDNLYGGEAGGLYKSTDGGNTWHQLTNGLPEHVVQLNLAIAPSDPSRLYAVLSTTLESPYESGEGLGFFRSDDAGASWYRVTTDPRPVMLIGGGDLPMPAVDPRNPDIVYSTSIVTVRSTDGGRTWTSIRGAPGGDDYQNIWINPNDPSIIFLASDQGAIISVDNGQSWSSWYNQPTAQLYHVQTNNEFPYQVCSGQQESGSVCIASRGNDGRITFRDWHPVGAIEYGYVAPDPLDPDIVYGAGRNVVTRYHRPTGQVQDVTPIPLLSGEYRVDRTQPIIFSPVDPHILYYAASRVFRTEDGGRTWQTVSPDLGRQNPGIPSSLGTLADKDPAAAKKRGVVYALGPSFKSVDTLWAGTDDGLIWVTRNGGSAWTNVTPPEITPWSKVTQITASHFDDQSAYASVSRFRVDDLRPYIYRSHDGGRSWELITAGLPSDAPVNAVREDPERPGLLFAGTETGVWVSFDDGDHWQSLQLNLPHTSMRDLWIHDDDLIVATHGRSFWILDDLSPLRQITEATAAREVVLFKPARAYRVRRDTNTDTPLPPDVPAGENPPDGAILDYYLARPSSGAVTLEILDTSGKLVRRYSSEDVYGPSEKDLSKQLIPLYWLRPPRVLSTDAGMHRWIWDLRYPAPEATNHSYPISAVPHDTPLYPVGPLVLPGRYEVRLTAGGQSVTQPLTIEMDPRVKTPPSGLEQQFELEMRLSSLMSDSSHAVNEARSIIEQIEGLAGKAVGTLSDQLTALKRKVDAALHGSTELSESTIDPTTLSKLNNEVSTLYGMVGQADVAPTPVQIRAAQELEGEWPALQKRWEDTKELDLARVNHALQAAGLTEIRPEVKPTTEAAPVNLE